MFDKLREAELSKSLIKDAIVDLTSTMLAKSIPITHAGKIQMEVKKVNDLELSIEQVRKVLKTEMGMTYR